MKKNTNIHMLQQVASALGEMRKDVVFVGGAVVELYATDPAAPPVRPTIDVDCIASITSRGEYGRIEKVLGNRGFKHDKSANAPICRWLYGELKMDLMPVDRTILGFANRWHASGIGHAVNYELPDETIISILSPPFFIASKLEALRSRGGDDWRGEPDFEDIIFVLDNRVELPDELSKAPVNVRDYLQSQFERIVGVRTITEDIVSVISPAAGAERVDYIMNQISKCVDPE